jgi:hypothetical protein
MQNTIQSNKQPNKVVAATIAFLLWLGTAAVGLWQISVVREMIFVLFARLRDVNQSDYLNFKQAALAGALGSWLLVVLAIVWIAAFVGGAEYHYRHVGQPRSWRLFAWTVGLEAAIFILSWFTV